MRFIRRNAIALVALVFSMSGTGIAASHYLITSTNQIKPSVLKKLKARGASGPRGLPGPQGVSGPKGNDGSPGVSSPGSPATTLPSGQSESGEYTSAALDKGLLFAAVNFPIPLPPNEFGEGINYKKALYLKPKEVTGQCPAVGKAAAGFLCIYSSHSEGVSGPRVSNYERYEGGEGSGAGRFGFVMEWLGEGGYDAGSWTVTAE